MKYAWKVFRVRHDGMYTSLLVRGIAQIEYPLNVKVTSPEPLAKEGYYPTVFNNHEDAKSFVDQCWLPDDTDIAIEKVEVGEDMSIKPMLDRNWLSLGMLCPETRESEDGLCVEAVPWPDGTKMVEWVKRIEQT